MCLFNLVRPLLSFLSFMNNFVAKKVKCTISKYLYVVWQAGIYYEHITRWLQHFPRDNLLVLDGELFLSDPAAVLQVSM